MKTKIVKSHGLYKLIVADNNINKKYHFEHKPIVLGAITEFAEAGQWRVEDFRLTKNHIPSPYLDDGVEQYKPMTEDERKFLIDNLHTYEIDEKIGIFYWPRFNSALYDGGDHPCLTNDNMKQYSAVARFTFKKAFQLLQEQKSFWTTFNSDNLLSPDIAIENSYRQMCESEVYSHFTLISQKKSNSINVK